MATLSRFFQLMITFMLYCHFQNVETVSECKRRSPDPNETPQSTFELFHMHGPCSPTAEMNMPASTQDILEGDRLRVESLKARFKPKSKTNKYDSHEFQDTKQLVEVPANVVGDIYAITISLGTPEQNLVLSLDTASDLTWTRCFPNSYSNRINLDFKPSDSTSFSSISCTSVLCTQLIPDHTCVNNFTNTNNYTCGIQDIDRLQVNGVLSVDKLKITGTSEEFFNWIFVCATKIDSDVIFNIVAGTLGLGANSSLSFVRETDQKYGRIFSYCIPSDTRLTGFLKLGKTDYPKPLNFTPFITNSDYPTFYFINITSISVGDVQLPIDTHELLNPGTVIDSAISITRLPINVYTTMRDEFRKQMNNSGDPKMFASLFDLFDTCYDFSKHPNITFPTITFTFNGDVTLKLGVSATFYDADLTTKCLAFVGDDYLPVFGITQQKTLEVVYDYEGKGLGFIPNGCK